MQLGSQVAAQLTREVIVEETVRFKIGAEAGCSDGLCGEIRRIVIDPVERVVSHLVVEPKHREALGRLVPMDLVRISNGEVKLECTKAEFDELELGEEMEFLPASGGHFDYPIGEALPEPYYGLGDVLGVVPQPVVYDTFPKGEIEVRRDEQVQATDGAIGSVQGLVVEPESSHVIRFVLREGHLWGRREVAIPVSVVTSLQNGIHLNITKKQVQELPPINVSEPTP